MRANAKTPRGRRARTLSLCLVLCLVLCLTLLPGCAAKPGADGPSGGSAGPGSDPACPEETTILCRIADGAEEGSLLLAAQGGEGELLYRLTVGEGIELTLDGDPAAPADLQDGMLVNIAFGGEVLESYPAQLTKVSAIHAHTDGQDDRCGLALQIFEDLWAEDSGLNGGPEDSPDGGLTYFGIEIDPALLPEPAERAAAAWRFAELHGVQPLTGSWQQLADEGYIDAEALYWEDGLFFSLTPTEGSAQREDALFFTAEKWRSGLGAIFFTDCAAARDAAGRWQYETGGFAIA